MHRALVRVGLNCAAMTMLRYDPAGAHSMKIPWREDRLHEVSKRNLVDHRIGAGTATTPSPPSSSLLLTWIFFVTLIIPCRQILVCLIFVGRGTHGNLSPTKFFPFTVCNFLMEIFNRWKLLCYATPNTDVRYW